LYSYICTDTTFRLLRAAREAENQHSKAYESLVAAIRDDHLRAARSYIKSTEILNQLIAEVEEECKDLTLFLAATQRVGEISPRMLDTVISKGENLCCRFIASILRDLGVDAEFVDLSNVLGPTSKASAYKKVDQDFYDALASTLGDTLSKLGNKVPVITGYFGTIPGGLLSQIGRGYTDLCAALVAVGLQASELQVVKEVEGVFTADPRRVPTARLLPTITPAEAAELTFYGSEVIHPFTMEQVIRARIPIRIKNVKNPMSAGTTILPDPLVETSYPQHLSSPLNSPPASPLGASTSTSCSLFRPRSSTNASSTSIPAPKRPTAITIKHKILVMNVHSNKCSLSHGFFARIFSTLDHWRLSVDLISTSEVHVSMAIHSESALVSGDQESKRIVDSDLEGAVRDLQTVGSVNLIDGMAILSLVGMQMKHMVGIAGRMFSVLGDAGVNIEMISQGA